MDRAERTGLGLALAGHALLFGTLSLNLLRPPALPRLETSPVEVSLVDEVALQSTAPAPAPEAALPAPEIVEAPAPAPAPAPAAQPAPKAAARAEPKPAAKTEAKPVVRRETAAAAKPALNLPPLAAAFSPALSVSSPRDLTPPFASETALLIPDALPSMDTSTCSVASAITTPNL